MLKKSGDRVIRLSLSAIVLSLIGNLQIAQVGAAEHNLVLALELEKASTFLGEPVYVRVQLSNNGRSPTLVLPSLYPEDGALQITIDKVNEKPRAYLPLYLDTTTLEMAKLAPGESMHAAFPIFFGSSGWTFQTPGTYRLSASFKNPASGKQQARSQTVDLIVKSGDGAGRFLLNDEKASTEAGKFLLWQSGDHLRGGIAHLEELMEKYPSSLIVDYVRLAFAHNLSRPFRDYRIGKIRKAKPDSAMEYLKQVDINRLPDYLKVTKLVVESNSLQLLGRTEEAKSSLRKAREITEKQLSLQPILEQALEK